MLIDISSKVAIVTGAARGIGRTIADRFEEEGAIVCRWDREWDDDSVPAGEKVDVTDAAGIDAAVADVVRRHGRIDILVNNAGIIADAPVVDLPEEAWSRVIDVNLSGVFRVCKAVAPIMQKQHWGRIINAASFAAIVPSFGSSSYAASKAGVVYFTRVLAGELGPWGITVNSYAPGMVPTQINHYTERPAPEQKQLLNTLTLQHWEDAEDVANLLCFLASEQAGYITGTLIDISGGKLATQRPDVAYQWAAGHTNATLI